VINVCTVAIAMKFVVASLVPEHRGITIARYRGIKHWSEELNDRLQKPIYGYGVGLCLIS
jgi:hypothetical protein